MRGVMQLLFRVVFFLFLAFPSAALAQGADDETALLKTAEEQIAAALRRMEDAELGDEALVELRLEMETLGAELQEYGQEIRPKLEEVSARLEELGPPPEEGAAPEADVVTRERRELAEQKSEISARIGEAEDAAARANEIADRAAARQREKFAKTLFSRTDLRAAAGPQAAAALRSESRQVQKIFSSWLSYHWSHGRTALLAATALSLLAGAALLWGSRRSLGRLLPPRSAGAQPYYLTRLTVGFLSAVLPSAVLALWLAASHAIFTSLEIFRGDVGAIMREAMLVIAVVYFIYRLAQSVLAPDRPDWRLLQVSDRGARLLFWLVVVTAFVHGLDFFLGRITNILNVDLVLTASKGLVGSVVMGLLVIAIALVKPFEGQDGGPPRPWPPLIRWPMLGAGVFLIFAALTGYVGLARFAAQQIVLTGAILVTMYIGLSSARAISDRGKLAQTTTGRRLVERFSFDDTALDQLALAIGLTISALVIGLGVPLILLQWGFQLADIRAWAIRLGSGFSVGNVHISITGILVGVLVFAVGLLASRWFQRWLDNTVMSRGRIDPGVRNSIRTAAGYAGIALAGLIAVAAAGINLSSLAFVAGALSLGIGFGLQNIVSNFVSGLILLAERPIKVGDWVITSSTEGFVRKISVRATEIETFHRQTVIVPNSEFINAPVSNWTHRNRLGRVDVDVGVSYNSDPQQVQSLLMQAAEQHELVLGNPEPFVAFVGFGESSIDFQLRVYIADILDKAVVGTDLHFSVFELLREAGVEIPFPQRDVHLKGGEPDEAARPAVPAAARKRPAE